MTIDDVRDLCTEYGFVDNSGYDALRYWLRDALSGEGSVCEDCGKRCACSYECDECAALTREVDEANSEIKTLRDREAVRERIANHTD